MHVQAVKEREAGCSGACTSVFPGAHLPLLRCSPLPAFWLLGRPWQCLGKRQISRVDSVSTAGSLLNPKDPKLQKSSLLLYFYQSSSCRKHLDL